jgi:uncharacterized delta-60 repeat protein
MKKIFTKILTLLAFATYAQPGTIDLTFNTTDVGFSYVDIGANNVIRTTSIQSNGKILIGGNFTSYNGISRNRIALLNTDGTTDLSFNSEIGADNVVRTTSVQSDGKIIIGGDFTSYNGISRNRIARLNSDGTVDGIFNPNTGANNIVHTSSIQSDGKIIIGGEFTSYNGIVRNRIARLNTDGTLDITFNPGTGAGSSVLTTSIQSDGKIIIGGNFTSYNGIARKYIARLNTDGTLDITFNLGSGANNSVLITSIQSDGKIIIGGNFTSYNGISRNRIGRLNTDGTLDANFNPGTGANNSVMTISIQSDAKIIIGGNFTSYNEANKNYIVRLNTDGTLDTFFYPGTGADSSVWTTSIQNNGKIVIGGNFAFYNGVVIKRIASLNTNGTIDLPFTTGIGGADNSVLTTSIQSDGKIIAGGNFTSYNGIARNYIARLNSDGTLDTTFNSGTGPNNSVLTTSIQNNGKIIIGGDFTSYNGTLTNRIVRLNSDGTLDTTFNPTTVINNSVRTTSIQSDGKVIIGGDFSNAFNRNYIARLNTDGTFDNSYNLGTGVNNSVRTTSIQSDGKIIIGGDFTSYNGFNLNYIARLNTDGTLDLSSAPGTRANNPVYSSSIQSDGKIIVGGKFSSYNGTLINRIARINTDGTLDAIFNPGTGAYGNVWTTSIQNDGKIIIGGDFTSFNGIVRDRIARLNTDGTLDTTFNPSTGASNSIYTNSIQSDGKIIIGGDFTSYNGTGKNRIARINGNNQLSNLDFEKNNIVIYPNPSKGVFNFILNNELELKHISVYTILGQKIFSKDITDKETIINISGQPKGVYFYKVIGQNGEEKSDKLIVE